MRVVAILAVAIAMAWASAAAKADVGLVLACSTSVGVEGKKLGEACSSKRWTAPTAGKAVAACNTTSCDLNTATWQFVEKLTASSRVYRCSANITPETGGGMSPTLAACAQRAWGSFTPPPPVETPPAEPPPVTSGPTVKLSWDAPTVNTDGSVLTDLAAYVVRYGREQLDQSVRIPAGLVRYEIPNLAPGSWRFTLAAVNRAGVESVQTGVVSATVEAPPPDPKTPAPPTNVTIVIDVKPAVP